MMQSQRGLFDRGLIIRKPWIDLILSGQKTWEMRSTVTKVRGRIGLIEQGSGLIVGECFLRGVGEKINPSSCEKLFDFHKVGDFSLLEKWCIPWVLSDAIRYEKPIPYQHPPGAVTWVRL